MKSLRCVWSALLAGALAASAHGATVVLSPVADATIFQNNVNNGSGAGNALYAGKNTGGFLRRALVAFDFTGSVPAGSTVESVELTGVLGNLSGGSPPPLIDVALHRVTASWGEGTTQQQIPPNDSLSGAGQGAPAVDGDVTWNSRFHSATSPVAWTSPGGEFNAAVSGSAAIGVDLSFRYAFPTSAGLVADVQSWVDDPASNFGWLLKVVDEAAANSLRGFYSDDVATAELRPRLSITFAPPAVGDADFDDDGMVDGDDLAEWSSSFGASSGADADGDGDSDGADFLAWQRELAMPSAAAVPEPNLWSAMMASVVWAFCLHRVPLRTKAFTESP